VAIPTAGKQQSRYAKAQGSYTHADLQITILQQFSRLTEQLEFLLRKQCEWPIEHLPQWHCCQVSVWQTAGLDAALIAVVNERLSEFAAVTADQEM